jgi:hypothetical protein
MSDVAGVLIASAITAGAAVGVAAATGLFQVKLDTRRRREDRRERTYLALLEATSVWEDQAIALMRGRRLPPTNPPEMDRVIALYRALASADVAKLMKALADASSNLDQITSGSVAENAQLAEGFDLFEQARRKLIEQIRAELGSGKWEGN